MNEEWQEQNKKFLLLFIIYAGLSLEKGYYAIDLENHKNKTIKPV